MSFSTTAQEPPDRKVGRLLLASEGRVFTPEAIAAAAERVAAGGNVLVFSIARIWGTALGLPNPWLLPSKPEWRAQGRIVADAVAALEARGVAATGKVIGARNAARRIVKEAELGGFEAIMMAADVSKPRLISGLFWSQEPQRVRRLASVPVFLIGPEA